jgi:hypothetical protein
MKGEKEDARYGLSWTNIRCENPQPSRENSPKAMHDGGLRFLLANEARATSLHKAILIVAYFKKQNACVVRQPSAALANDKGKLEITQNQRV